MQPIQQTPVFQPTLPSYPAVGCDTSDPSEPVDGRVSVSATVVDDSIAGLQTVEVEVANQDESGNGIYFSPVHLHLAIPEKLGILGSTNSQKCSFGNDIELLERILSG